MMNFFSTYPNTALSDEKNKLPALKELTCMPIPRLLTWIGSGIFCTFPWTKCHMPWHMHSREILRVEASSFA
jgi:hypothetical protein